MVRNSQIEMSFSQGIIDSNRAFVPSRHGASIFVAEMPPPGMDRTRLDANLEKEISEL